MTVPVDDGNCFACGPENRIGLHLSFEPFEEGVHARITLAQDFQGWKGIAHGGIAMSLLDEAMAHAAGHAGHRGVTASLNVRFRKPVPLGEQLDVYGCVTWHRRNVMGVQARVVDSRGVVLLDGDGKFVSMGPLDAVEDRRSRSWAR